jgi:sec-independent protein translocase protein TatB
MFDIGWGELVVIGIVALIAIGPKELPTVLRSVGQWIGKIKRMAAEFQGQFQEALREAEMTDLKKQAEEMTSSVTDFSNFNPMADAQTEMERAFMPEAPIAGEGTTAPAAVPDGATLPAGVLPEINVPLPEMPAPVSEKDFAPAEPAPPKEPDKQPGGGA